MNIGLLGFGVVGRGVYEITAAREDTNQSPRPINIWVWRSW